MCNKSNITCYNRNNTFKGRTNNQSPLLLPLPLPRPLPLPLPVGLPAPASVALSFGAYLALELPLALCINEAYRLEKIIYKQKMNKVNWYGISFKASTYLDASTGIGPLLCFVDESLRLSG
jgi:hypothetical protein